jgi:hypothetical protein
MFGDLLRLYENSRSHSPNSRPVFAETSLFNEGWLLAGVLDIWSRRVGPSQLPFLPMPPKSKVRAPVQMYAPFRKVKRGDLYGETNTRADGIAGHFVGNQSKSGVLIQKDATYFASFEAKMYSNFSPIKNSPYSQVARTICCMVHAAIKARVDRSATLHFAVLYPEDNHRIVPSRHGPAAVTREIEERIALYRMDGRLLAEFESKWRSCWERVKVTWVTWEAITDELGDRDLREFYGLCKKFG